MPIHEIGDQSCAVARSIAVVGDPWTLMVLRELFLGTRRFDDLRVQTGVSPHLLSVRMRALTESGVVERLPYQQKPLRHEYRLTRKGLDLWPVVMALKAWSDRWADWPEGRPVRLRHHGCGKVTQPQLTCHVCGEAMGPQDVDLEMSEAAVAERVRRSQGRAA